MGWKSVSGGRRGDADRGSHLAEGMTQRGPLRTLLQGMERVPADTGVAAEMENGDGG
ncbi:hypothetical protein [Arthrobacter sp. NPDC056493]|uniref:hypothetical protein n=1 Tax=Arthrobacter sp. NPDC056493 TaxID=3345839 RepID=UPI00366BBD94